MSEASFASSNPFRRKAAAGSGTPAAPSNRSGNFGSSSPPPAAIRPSSPPSTLPSSDSFRSQLEALPHSSQPPPSTSFQKPKVVKRVRVQSPPPSSPEPSPELPAAYGDGSSAAGSDADEGVEQVDPFRGNPPPVNLSSATPGFPSPSPSSFPQAAGGIRRQAPRETLSQTPSSTSATGGKGSFNVESFRNLLLTGVAGGAGDAANNNSTAPLSASRRETENLRTAHDVVSDMGEDDRAELVAKPTQPPSTLKKKPRPPSSRHGRLIGAITDRPSRGPEQTQASGDTPLSPSSSPRREGRGGGTASPPAQWPSPPSDVNKPLPAAPASNPLDAGTESIFDKEAAGKVPEPDVDVDDPATLPPPRPPTPPNASHATAAATETPRATAKPAPPPRRNPHARMDSRSSVATRSSPPTTAATAAPTAPPVGDQGPVRRSSADSNRSRSSSLRVSVHAPAPPPPRRPAHSSRQSVSFTSPSSAVSFSSAASGSSAAASPTDPDAGNANTDPTTAGPATTNHASAGTPSAPSAPSVRGGASGSAARRHGPPPPPPTRNPSTRSSRSGRPASVSSLDAATTTGVSLSHSGSGSGSVSGAITSPRPPPPRKKSRAGSGAAGTAGPGGDGAGEPQVSGGLGVAEERLKKNAEDGERQPEGGVGGVEGGGTEESAASGILADLDALQREVDALRGRYEQVGSGAGDGAGG